MSQGEPITLSTVIPDWYDPLDDDGAAAEAAVAELVKKFAGTPVAAVALADTTATADGPVWTWQVWLEAT